MKLFSYVVTADSGFAPNPYWGYCTLATCKPVIRRCARVGDWIVGAGSKNGVGQRKLIYAMRVDEVLSIAKYDLDPRFESKKPVDGSPYQRCGDNIYFKEDNGAWTQRRSYHTAKNMETDLSGRNVLVSENFYYFGGAAIELPTEYESLMATGRGHQSNFNPERVGSLIAWLQSNFTVGLHGEPRLIKQRVEARLDCSPSFKTQRAKRSPYGDDRKPRCG